MKLNARPWERESNGVALSSKSSVASELFASQKIHEQIYYLGNYSNPMISDLHDDQAGAW